VSVDATAGTMYGMVKTTVREAIANAGRSARPRRLRSAAVGRGSGAAVARHADEIVRRELGRSTG
jgi:hypothetical protein